MGEMRAKKLKERNNRISQRQRTKKERKRN